MKPIREMTWAELGAHVQSHFRMSGIDVVLSGGAAFAIYTGGKFVSGDLDVVNRVATKGSTKISIRDRLMG